MYICDPKDNIVLILSHFWTPINITNAKEGIKKIMSPDIKAISNGGEPLTWEDWIDPTRACYYNDQPFLRSKRNIFPVPTVLLTSSSWSYKCQQKPNINYLYSRYKGRCQICGKKLPIKKMSIEHILPKSKGGNDGYMNLTMTCKSCNAKKGSIYPYSNYKGKELKAFGPIPYFHSFLKRRDEWAIFLFKNSQKIT